MKVFVVYFVAVAAIVQINAFPTLVNPEHHIDKRQINWNINHTGASVSATGTNTRPNSQWSGTATAQHNWKPSQTTVGGTGTWTHTPTGSHVTAGASHTFGQPGTNVGASGQWNVVHKPQGSIGLTGNVGANIGGGSGTRPTWGGGIIATWNLPGK